MTAPIPARSRTLRETPVWREQTDIVWWLTMAGAPLGAVMRFGEWNAYANSEITLLDGSPYPTRAAAMAAVEAAVLAPDDGWLPIETAPKDGTRVLVFERSAALGDVQIDWWADDEWLGDPTHWRPLPASPEDKA